MRALGLLALRPDWSFSKAPLARACEWWMQPDVPWTADEAPNEYRDGGRAVHHALALLANDGVIEIPEDATLAAMYAMARGWLEEESGHFKPEDAGDLPPLRGRAEVAFAYDLATDTARELVDPPGAPLRWYADPELRAKYGILDTEICGRLDLVAPDRDERGAFLRVDDYKFHWAPNAPSAAEQLKVCALAASRARGISRVHVRGVHVWDTVVTVEPLELGAWELDEVAAWLRGLAGEDADEAANDPQPNPGPHCERRHCPAISACPMQTGATGELVALIPAERLARGAHSLARAVTTPTEAAWSLTALELVEAALDAKKKELRAWADAHEGIVREDGTVYAAELVPSESIDAMVPGVLELLEEEGLDFAVRQATSWEAIKKVGGLEAEKRMRVRLRAAGLAKVSSKKVYDTRPAKRGARGAA